MSKSHIAIFHVGAVFAAAVIGGEMLRVGPLVQAGLLASKLEPPQTQIQQTSELLRASKQSYALEGYCPVTLVDNKRMPKARTTKKE